MIIKKNWNVKLAKIVIILMIVTILIFTSCSKSTGPGGGGNGSDETGGSDTSGWPANNILSQYGLSGMTAPTGASNIQYVVQNPSGPDSYLTITFNGTSATDSYISSWFSNHSNVWEVSSVQDNSSLYFIYCIRNDPNAPLGLGGAARYQRYKTNNQCGFTISTII